MEQLTDGEVRILYNVAEGLRKYGAWRLALKQKLQAEQEVEQEPEI